MGAQVRRWWGQPDPSLFTPGACPCPCPPGPEPSTCPALHHCHKGLGGTGCSPGVAMLSVEGEPHTGQTSQQPEPLRTQNSNLEASQVPRDRGKLQAVP